MKSTKNNPQRIFRIGDRILIESPLTRSGFMRPIDVKTRQFCVAGTITKDEKSSIEWFLSLLQDKDKKHNSTPLSGVQLLGELSVDYHFKENRLIEKDNLPTLPVKNCGNCSKRNKGDKCPIFDVKRPDTHGACGYYKPKSK